MKRNCKEISQLTISCCSHRPAVRLQSALPLTACRMTGAHDFVTGLARAGKGYKEIKETVDTPFGDKTLSENGYLGHYKEGKRW
jgi:hypothetical protein